MSNSAFTRRGVNLGLAAACGAILLPGRARAADFAFRQYHNQPVESPLHRRLVEMWAAVGAETGGRVHVQIFPENNHLKDGDPNPLDLVVRGELEFLTLAGNGLSSLVPAADVQATPFAFRNPDQVYRAMDGDLGDYLRDELKTKGVYAVPGGCFENGFHQITCTTKPIRTAADLKGLKMRVPGSALYQDFFRSLGAEVHTMNINRIYAALKSGEVEAQDDPLDVVELFKFYEVQKYASMTDHSWSGYNMLANLKVWQGLPADVQRSIETNTRKFARLQRADTDALNERLREDLTKRGMIFNDADTASFRAALAPFYPRWKQAIGQRAWDLLEGHAGRLG